MTRLPALGFTHEGGDEREDDRENQRSDWDDHEPPQNAPRDPGKAARHVGPPAFGSAIASVASRNRIPHSDGRVTSGPRSETRCAKSTYRRSERSALQGGTVCSSW